MTTMLKNLQNRHEHLVITRKRDNGKVTSFAVENFLSFLDLLLDDKDKKLTQIFSNDKAAQYKIYHKKFPYMDVQVFYNFYPSKYDELTIIW